MILAAHIRFSASALSYSARPSAFLADSQPSRQLDYSFVIVSSKFKITRATAVQAARSPGVVPAGIAAATFCLALSSLANNGHGSTPS